jgi:CubicO group peptidase (beta-lactamase class C family)
MLLNAPYVDNSYKWAGGGFISTAEDLVTFGSALQHPGFLQARSLAMLFTSQRTRDGVPTGYGMGWSIDTLASGDTVLHHGGSSVGANAHLAIFPRSHLVIAAICNTTSHFVGAGTITRQLAALFAR